MKKIMFNDRYGLTDAVLSGRKTQTRRIVPQSVIDKYSMLEDPTIIDDARYEVGEVVAIAQSYKDVVQGCCAVDSRYDAFRRCNWGEGKDGVLESSPGWTNKMFVRADLMPHQIRITDMRVEQLQDISDEDCIKEGILYIPEIRHYYYFGGGCEKERFFDTPREAYAALIDKISGKGTWESNPYMFAYEFELIK